MEVVWVDGCLQKEPTYNKLLFMKDDLIQEAPQFM